MNASTENQSGGSLDTLKWGLVFLILAGIVVANYMYGEVSVLIRAVAAVVAVVVAGLIASQTEKGRTAIVFAKESRTEVRKVVWPTREEALKTTGLVIVATVFMAFLLWIFDTVLYWIVNYITSLQV
ncbi:preprotein translocase subunit SecE [Thalassotalea sp. PS06]|uniref:preprotein translocase subunit SecE n=1 Tax=Thalassotalea sp. PS06 TaxID=2594005 RepID=UPI001162B9F8|nr:preprotein translocase subunit SecE [Thalassotalea sp. PS06]QDP02527.1 preprotein translocase subunit SecE [Thalassotalea sp. PS06]